MKIVIEKNDKDKEKKEVVNKEIKQKETTPKYIVSGQKSSSGKAFALGMLGGIIGGTAAVLISNAVMPINNVKNNVETGKELVNTVTKEYTFSTVENPVVAISEKVGPSVVGVKVTYTSQNIWGILSENEGQGSGIIYSADGYIVTNYHVIEEAIGKDNAKVYVLFPDDESVEAKIVGYDSVTDMAVLKIDKKGLTAAEFGNSDEISVGELAVAIGNPLGEEFAGSVTVGYISATNRKIATDGTTYNLIQTDAAINSGNSGGPLVNASGKVIGVNTVKIASTGVEGMGFAIPSNDILPIIEELITNKKIVRPYIGVGGITLSKDLAATYNLVEGIYIQTVDEKGPAYIAGIKQGDVITEAEGKKVTSIAELNEIKYKKKVGDSIKLKIYREKEYKEITVVLTEQ